MDILAALRLASNAAGRQSPVTTFGDLEDLYGLYEQAKAGTLSLSALVKDGKLEPTIASIARTATLADELMKDPVQGPRLVALLGSLT